MQAEGSPVHQPSVQKIFETRAMERQLGWPHRVALDTTPYCNSRCIGSGLFGLTKCGNQWFIQVTPYPVWQDTWCMYEVLYHGPSTHRDFHTYVGAGSNTQGPNPWSPVFQLQTLRQASEVGRQGMDSRHGGDRDRRRWQYTTSHTTTGSAPDASVLDACLLVAWKT